MFVHLLVEYKILRQLLPIGRS